MFRVRHCTQSLLSAVLFALAPLAAHASPAATARTGRAAADALATGQPDRLDARPAGNPSVGPNARGVDPCLQQVNADGFGNANNRYAWAMKTFGDFLYVGTLNSTVSSSRLDPDLLPYELDGLDATTEGTEIWRYDGQSWQQVVDGGFGDINNSGTRNLAVYDGALYAGTLNSNTGCEVWRSTDGLLWRKSNTSGFGDLDNTSVRGMATWQDRLYVGTLNDYGGEIWSFDGFSWTMVTDEGITDAGNRAISAFHVYNDTLYAGTWNEIGCELYRFDGTDWRQLVGPDTATPAGFGDPDSGGIFSIVDFQDYLYVTTYNFASGFTMWRSGDEGETWEQVGTNGFGDSRVRYGWRMLVHDNQLYLGTFVMGYGSPTMFKLGGKMYRSANGVDWIEEVGPNGTLAPPGFGDGLNYGVRTLESFQGDLYAGTAQCFFCSFPVTGTEIWRRDTPTCDE